RRRARCIDLGRRTPWCVHRLRPSRVGGGRSHVMDAMPDEDQRLSRDLQEDAAAGVRTGPSSARQPWSWATTAAPSPIAPPTRFTEPLRTSPTAKTPGTVVSRVAGMV